MNKISKDDAYEVSDQTDWLTTPVPKLSKVDSALRCQVCKDFYTTPMTTSCSHTFCSLCIRRSLNNDGKCPACRTPDQELKLRFNGALEDVVEAFKSARPEVMEVATKPTQVVEPMSPKRKRREEKMEEENGSRKKPRTSGRRTRSSQTEVLEVMDSAGEDEDYLPEDGMVQCPVCQKRVKETGINSHLDQGCMDEPRVTKSLGRSNNKQASMSALTASEKPIKRPDRLPQLNFQFVKDPALRKKLTDQGLSAAGSRQLLERRYTEWVTLWNANCDATRPKSKGELKRELDIWDRTLGKNTTSVQGSQIKDKDFDGKGWSNTHHTDFKDLIAKARSKIQKPQTPAAVTTPTSAVTSSSTPDASNLLDENSPAGDTERIKSHGSLESYGIVEDSPANSRSRFFEEGSSNEDQSPPSQNRRTVTILEKNTGIASDMTTSQPLQP